MNLRSFAFLTILIPTLSACTSRDAKSDKPDVVASNVDTTMDPAVDFFQFANGGWLKQNPIPPEESSWGIGNLVIEENQKRLREICEKAAATKAQPGTPEQLIGDFWATGMDSASIEKQGLKALEPYLKRIDETSDIRSIGSTAASLKSIGSSTLFGDYVGQDAKNSDRMAYQLWQGGLGLPEREYYFKDDSATRNIREAYHRYIGTLLRLSGIPDSASRTAADHILAMETRLAKSHRKMEDLRDPYRNYNKMSASQLSSLCGAIDWNAYLTAMGASPGDSLIVGQPEFFQTLHTLLNDTPLDTWKMYLRFNLLSDMAAVLPDVYGQTSFDFYRLLSGAKKRKPRWKRIIQLEEGAMGEMMGRLYVQEFFNEKAKERYTRMVEDVRAGLKNRIAQLSWMSDTTKQKAYAKLASMKKKVGYPDKWKDFSAMKIGRTSLAENYIQSRIWWHRYEFNKLGKPVDRDEWSMYPQTYNAYYNPSNNEIVLPAGIFTVPGYRDEELDDAVVYGYGGASTIGHEITHGFDDEGRQFDDKGNLVSWWTADDEAAFKQRADVMVRQFDAYEPVKGYFINGKATLGENIADLGGVLLGLEAFKQTEQYKKNVSVAGYTPMQRYFMGYALGWLGHTREEQEKNRLLTDVHSPAKYRVNGPFVSVDAFYNTFSVSPGKPMYRPDSLRVRIW